jgi:DNA-binding NarL/FixJ family response regulator
MLSIYEKALFAKRVLQNGGDGYIMKQDGPEEIVRAIRDVLRGHLYVSEPVLADRPAASGNGRAEGGSRSLAELTDSELEVLEGLGRGKSTQEIARQLRVSAAVIAAECARMRKKLKLKSADALVRYAARWVGTDDGKGCEEGLI